MSCLRNLFLGAGLLAGTPLLQAAAHLPVRLAPLS